MKTIATTMMAWMNLVINGNCSQSTSFHRLGLLGGGAFVVTESNF